MEIASILSPPRTVCGVEGGSKKRVLELLANCIAQDIKPINTHDLFRRLVARERLGSTGIGQGIAIPHCRIEHCTTTVGALITLASPINFDAIDNEPVDLIFAMTVPEDANEQHLQTLASLAEALSNQEYVNKLRSARNDSDLFQAATQFYSGHMA